MPVRPDSRYAALPLRQGIAPDGSVRQVISLRLRRPDTPDDVPRHRLTAAEPIDLLARRFYRDERLWWHILDANDLVYPLDLAPGAMLRLPVPGAATRVSRARSF